MPLPPQEHIHWILRSHHADSLKPNVHALHKDIDNRPGREQKESPGNLQYRRAPQKPLHEAKRGIDYPTAASEPIIAGQVVRITYVLSAETGQLQEYCRTCWSKLEQENTWTTFQAHFIEAQADLWERQKTFRQGRYHTGTAKNSIEMSMVFANLSQATAEYCAVITNLTTTNIILTEQVVMYANPLSTK